MSTEPHLRDRVLHRLFLRVLPDNLKPNHLTAFRLAAAPFVAAIVWTENFSLAVPVFLAVAFTDMMDGSLARIRGQVTPWGTVWDPIADKVLVGSVAVSLLFHHFPPELAIIIFGLEAAFLIGGYYRLRQGRVVSANRWGKAKTFFQVLGLAAFMISLAVSAPWLAGAAYGILVVAMIFAIMSLFTHGL